MAMLALPLGVKAGVKAGLGKGLPPYFVVKMLGPGIKPAAQFPGAMDNPAHPPVAP